MTCRKKATIRVQAQYRRQTGGTDEYAPFGRRKHAVSGAGRVGAARTLAPRNKEYGTIRIGLVGNARHGCGGGDSPGLALVGGDALTEEEAATVAAGCASFTTCLVLQ